MMFFTLVVMMMYPADAASRVRTVCTLTSEYLVYVQDNDRWTPLISAALSGHTRCIQLLLEYVPKVM